MRGMVVTLLKSVRTVLLRTRFVWCWIQKCSSLSGRVCDCALCSMNMVVLGSLYCSLSVRAHVFALILVVDQAVLVVSLSSPGRAGVLSMGRDVILAPTTRCSVAGLCLQR